jgi:prepilin-type N-terminal cleavage/methylation domain-containing protein
MNFRRKPGSAGFTLLEITVTAGILAVLAAIAWPALSLAVAKSHSAGCLSNLRGLGIALNLYLADHGGIMPALAAARAGTAEDVPVIDTVLAPYAGERKIFRCPADDRLAATTGTSYFYNSALGGQRTSNLNFLGLVDNNSRIPVLVDKEGWHRVNPTRVNHLFADGHSSNELRLFSE